jgi:hypothetical protein
VLVTIAIGVVAFELLPDIKDHVGGEVGGAILLFFFDMVAIWLVFFLLFRQWGSPWLNDRAYDFDPVPNMALQTAIYMTIIHFVAILLFSILFYGGWLWQFWIAFIIFAFAIIVAIIVTVVVWWRRRPKMGEVCRPAGGPGMYAVQQTADMGTKRQ